MPSCSDDKNSTRSVPTVSGATSQSNPPTELKSDEPDLPDQYFGPGVCGLIGNLVLLSERIDELLCQLSKEPLTEAVHLAAQNLSDIHVDIFGDDPSDTEEPIEEESIDTLSSLPVVNTVPSELCSNELSGLPRDPLRRRSNNPSPRPITILSRPGTSSSPSQVELDGNLQRPSNHMTRRM